MRVGCKTRLGRDLGRLFRLGAAPSGDRALLERFRTEGDHEAFAMLVDRHGPMVRGVCRRLLISPHDADDAFQATFLVLVKKAGQIRDADGLGPWLYGVARRVATKARAREARRRDRDPIRDQDLGSARVANLDLIDVLPIFDAELGRVPAKLRDVLVLCLLEGATAEEASMQLGCPVGTVKSRLARGREAIRRRLTDRGVAPGAFLAANSSDYQIPASASLTRATLDAIAGPSAGVAPGIATLMRGVAPAMMSRTALMSFLLLGGIALAGMTTWLRPAAQAQQPPEAPTDANKARAMRRSIDNLKLTMLAIHNYHSANDHFPPAAILGADGEPKLSWRVALLPYLENGSDLYKEFRRDEPWDSPHNKALIGRMPAVYQTPHSPAPDGQTRFLGIVGKGTMFDGLKGVPINQVTDGLANTVMVAVARDPVPWTKPEDLPFETGRPLPALDEAHPKGPMLGMTDGAVLIPAPKDAVHLPWMLTRNGGEVFQWAPEPNRPDMPKAATASSPTPTPRVAEPPGSVDQRLKRLEDKLDRLIEKVDSLGIKKP